MRLDDTVGEVLSREVRNGVGLIVGTGWGTGGGAPPSIKESESKRKKKGKRGRGNKEMVCGK